MARRPASRISTFGSRITSVISVALVLVILGLLAMTLGASNKLGQEIRGNIGFIVKIHRDATDADIASLKRTFAAEPYAEKVTYLSADEILASESQLMGEDINALLDENPFGAEFDIKVSSAYASADSIAAVSRRITAMPSIDEVVSEMAIVDSINSSLGRLTVVLIAIAIALLIISFVLINNTVSLSIYSRRFIIYTMKLVGATGGFIRRPFLRAGLGTGLCAAVIASLILAGLRFYAAKLDSLVETALPWEKMWMVFAVVFVVGPLICLLASAIATNRYLRADYDDMFMK